MAHEPSHITILLRAWRGGDAQALERLTPLVYDHLRRMAAGYVVKERVDRQWNATALVHEAYLKLVKVPDVSWQHRAHFYAVAARLMRQVLIDYARAKKRDKRGGGAVRVSLAEAVDLPTGQADELMDLNEALTRLEAHNERLCRVVECRCVAGLSVEETAAALGTSPATVKRDWAFARAWLNRELGGGVAATQPRRITGEP
jgi:RNA polymerase sigma factor (TIGR02999 family)